MGFEIIPANRSGILPLIGFQGRSGGGKTRSALILMRGMVGPQGKITLIDTERKRGHIFADVIPGGYNVIDFDEPFSSDRYCEAIDVAVKQKSDGLIIDSQTHEWDGEGGVLDYQETELTRMAGDDWKKREACKMAAWIKPKSAHKKLVQKVLRLPIPVICCLRGAEKTHMSKDDRGKTVVTTDKVCSPIYDPRFLFEMLICGEVYEREGKGGFLRIEKITHEALFECLPRDGEQITYRHGELLAAWCAQGKAKPETGKSGQPQTFPRNLKPNPSKGWGASKCRVWDLTYDSHAGNPVEFAKHLIATGFMDPAATLNDLSDDDFAQLLARMENQ